MKALILAASAMVMAGPTVGQTSSSLAKISLTRLDCGTGQIKDFNAFFSDSFDYRAGPRQITDSCYLIRHGSKYLLWDTGFPAGLKGKPRDMGHLVASSTRPSSSNLRRCGSSPLTFRWSGSAICTATTPARRRNSRWRGW